MKNRILITGGAGFIGYHVSLKLIDEDYEVINIDNINDYYDIDLKYDRLEKLGIQKKEAEIFGLECKSKVYNDLIFIRVNIEDRVEISKLFAFYKFDYVIHLAAQAGVRYSLENPNAYVDSNIVGFLNILENSRQTKVKHLVYASSSSVYGQNEQVPFSENDRIDTPISLYAATKKSNELMAYTYSHLYGLKTSGLRFFTVYGPWGRPDMAMFLFTNAIVQKKPIKVFNNGEMLRDFTYIDDIVQGVKITLENPSPNALTHDNNDIWYKKNEHFQVLNIGNGTPVSLMEFITTIEKELNTSAQLELLPIQPGDVKETWADTKQLEKLGYRSTTPISVGVKKFIEWFNVYYRS